MSFLKSGFLIGKSSVLLPMHEDHGVLFSGELLSSIFICAHILQHNMPWRSLDKLPRQGSLVSCEPPVVKNAG